MYFSSRHWTRYFKSKLLQILFCIYHSHNQRSLFFIVFASDINCIIGKITTACLFHPDRYLNLIPCNLCLWLSNVKHFIYLPRILLTITGVNSRNFSCCYISFFFTEFLKYYFCNIRNSLCTCVIFHNTTILSGKLLFHCKCVICCNCTKITAICPCCSISTVLPLVTKCSSFFSGSIYKKRYFISRFRSCLWSRLRFNCNYRLLFKII